MNILNTIAVILLIVGGINWGLIGLVNMNIVDMIFGNMGLDRLIYILVGVSAVWKAVCWCKSSSCCK